MDEDKAMMITATVVTDDPDLAIRAGEVLSRACVGLMLEGIPSVSFNIIRGLREDGD